MRTLVITLLLWTGLLTYPSSATVSIKDDGCLKCHRLKGLFFVDRSNKAKDCSINESLYMHSMHRNVGCSECHDKIEAYPHDPKNTAANCANECHVIDPSTGKSFSHEQIVDTWERSVHGKNREKAPDVYPSCEYCHTNDLTIDMSKVEELTENLYKCSACHKEDNWTKDRLAHVYQRVAKSKRDGWEIVVLCSECHQDKEKMEKAMEIEGIKNIYKRDKILHAVESYKVTMHSKMLYLDREDTRAADCLDCHTNKKGNLHDIFRKDDKYSSINEANIEKTCGRASECHPLAEAKHMKRFATTKWVHMRPIPESVGQWIVWVVQGVFIALVTVVLLFASGFVILDLLKNLKGK